MNNMNYIYRIIPYRAVNTVPVGYKNQPFKDVFKNNRFLFRNTYETYKCTVWSERGTFRRVRKIVKSDN